MYYVCKTLQAGGLTIIFIGFLRSFPEVMDRKVLTMAILIFVFGWAIERFLLKR